MIQILTSLAVYLISIYSYSVTTVQGTTRSLETCKNKKILLVNVSSQSVYANQMLELEQLYQQYKGRLVVIAFPSNSLSAETKDNAALARWASDSFHVSFPVVQLSSVTGANRHPIYQWVGDITKNGVLAKTVTQDYQKILIDTNGEISGIFNAQVSPLDNTLRKAIEAVNP